MHSFQPNYHIDMEANLVLELQIIRRVLKGENESDKQFNGSFLCLIPIATSYLLHCNYFKIHKAASFICATSKSILRQ